MAANPTNIKRLFDKNFNQYAFSCFEYNDIDHKPVIGQTLDHATLMNDEDDINEVYVFVNGYNDDEPWSIVGKTTNNLYFYLSAWCDYTGFSCQGGCFIIYSNTWEDMYNYGVDNRLRELLDTIASGSLPDEVTDISYQCNPRYGNKVSKEHANEIKEIIKSIDPNKEIKFNNRRTDGLEEYDYEEENDNDSAPAPKYTIIGNMNGIPIYSIEESSSSSDDEAVEVFHGY